MPAPKRTDVSDRLALMMGRAIRATRRKRGVKAEVLAEMAQVRPQSVSHWETGRCVPSWEALRRISVALEVPMWVLVKVAEGSFRAEEVFRGGLKEVEE